jgi:hypothetical protein
MNFYLQLKRMDVRLRANTERILVSPETKERLEALKHDQSESLGDDVLRLTNGYFTDD